MFIDILHKLFSILRNGAIAGSDQNWLARCSTMEYSGKICSLPQDGKYWKSCENLSFLVPFSSILEMQEI